MARYLGQARKSVMPPQWGEGSTSGPSVGQGTGSGLPALGGAQGQGNASPTGWVNVQSYLDANKSQADAMGKNLAAGIEKEATTAATAADKYRADANAYANAPKTTLNPDFKAWMDSYTSHLATVGGDQKRMAEWYKDHGTTPPPQAGTATPGAAPVMPSSPAKALEKVQAAGTAPGRAELFAQKAGPSYNAGQSNLDSYLAGAGAGGQALQGLGQKFGNVLDIVRYPYPGYPTAGNRPGGPSNGAEGGTVPLPGDKKPGDPAYGNGGVSGPAGARPGGTPWQPEIGKRKRFA
jgi:hypothetical protein